MFWRKKSEEEPKKGRLKAVFKYLALALLVVFLVVIGGAVWLTQSQSGLAWIQKTANGFLENGKPLAFRITRLEGSLPFNFTFGLEASDETGRWLSAPQNVIVWDWKKLPATVMFRQISAEKLDIQRFPALPKGPEANEPPAKPFTVRDAQELLAKVADFVAEPHWWLPAIRFEAISVDALLPESLLPATGDDLQRLALDATLALQVVENNADAGLRAQLRNALASQIYAPSVSLDSLSLNLAVNAGPQQDGLKAQAKLDAEALNPRLSVKDIPETLLGDAAQLDLGLTASANTKTPAMAVALAGPNLEAGQLNLAGKGEWKSGKEWKDGRVTGRCAYNLELKFDPPAVEAASPLAALKSPLTLKFGLTGDLPKVNSDLNVACASLEGKGYVLKDTSVSLAARDVAIPYDEAALAALAAENELELAVHADFENQKIAFLSRIFFQAINQVSGSGQVTDWRAGLRDFTLDALGMTGRGNVVALLPHEKKPALDGNLDFRINSWDALGRFMPDQKLSGDVDLEVSLSSGLPADMRNPLAPLENVLIPDSLPGQDALISLKIPALAMSSEKKAIFEGDGISGQIEMKNIFDDLFLKANLAANKIAASGLKLSAAVGAEGKLSGPLNLDVSSKGSVNSKIAAQWSPGLVKLGSLEATADLSSLLQKKGKMLAGIRSAGPAQAEYGKNGLKVSNLDLRILPSGRLQANGGLGPDRLDLRVNLDGLDFKPWQALVPALPAGAASLSATFAGTPKRPSGKFRLGVNRLVVPGVALAPVSLALSGAIEEGNGGSALKTRLELDLQTVKTLGGTVANISASVPLLFGPDGVPTPNMKGPLQAKARWDGALGPLWNLVPVADMRLNGRVEMDINAAGTLEKPRVNGYLAVNRARYENVLVGVLLTDINLRVDLADTGGAASKAAGAIAPIPGQMKLRLSMSDGYGGTLTASGGGSLDGASLDVKTRINDLKPLRRRDIHVELSGNVDVTGSALAPQIAGEIIVDKGEVLLNNLEMTGSVTTLDITQPQKKAAESAPPAKSDGGGGHLNVRVRMLPRFSVEGRGLASLWQANLLIAGPLTDPRVTGNISSVRGNFDFLGKIFALTRGVVFFGGGSLTNPLLDIELTHDTPDLTAHIFVTGPVNKIKIKLGSDPVVPRDEILSRVLFGRSVNDLSRMEALQLAGAVAQLAGFGGGSGPLGLAKKALGVDVLRIGTANTGAQNQTDEDTGGGTTVEMGKYINDYIYMGVQQGFAADSTAFIIEIEITPRTNFELRSEKNNTWGGIKWKYNY